jgi:hypothetical protein
MDAFAALAFWAFLIGAPAAAIAAVVAMARRSQPVTLGIASLVTPPLLFFVVALLAESQIQGLGLLLWPITLFLLACLILAARVFLLDPQLGASRQVIGAVHIVAVCAAATGFALVAPQWLK